MACMAHLMSCMPHLIGLPTAAMWARHASRPGRRMPVYDGEVHVGHPSTLPRHRGYPNWPSPCALPWALALALAFAFADCRCFLLMSRLPMRLHGQGFCLSLAEPEPVPETKREPSAVMLCLLLHGQVRECLILPVFQCLGMALAMVVAIYPRPPAGVSPRPPWLPPGLLCMEDAQMELGPVWLWVSELALRTAMPVLTVPDGLGPEA
eukprot:s1493_g15.t1